MTSVKELVIYHAGCVDGWCSAWLASRYWAHDREALRLHPANYGEAPPRHYFGKESGPRWLIVDFSYPREIMRELLSLPGHGHCLDHHKTAMAELADLGGCRFDMTKCGAEMLWDYIGELRNLLGQPALNKPWLIDYVADRDLWKHALPMTKEVNASLRSYPFDLAVWDDLAFIETPRSLAKQGRHILRDQKKVIDSSIQHAGMTTVVIGTEAWDVPVVNATLHASEVAGALADDAPFAMVYFDRRDGKRVYSLRSRPEGVDVSVIAKAFGGGGHARAAGFEIDLVQPVLNPELLCADQQKKNASDHGEGLLLEH